MEKKLQVEGMTCQNCVKRVKKIIEKNDGISNVSVILENKKPFSPVRTQQIFPVLSKPSTISALHPQKKHNLINRCIKDRDTFSVNP